MKEVDFVDVIRKEILSVDDFIKLPPVPLQRYTEGRAKTSKVKKMLSGEVRPEHLDVAVVELTRDCEYFNEKYPKGWRGIVNGNTRKYFWERGLSKSRPKNVFATVYLLDSMDAVRECYNTFDSPDATEANKEKLYGILCRMYKYDPVCSKIIKGEFLTALNLACHYLDPVFYNQSTTKTDYLPGQVGHYFDEIIKFDQVCVNPKAWDQALLCSAFMSMKKYGTNNSKLLDCLLAIDNRAMNTTTRDRDGATHICLEWETNDRFKSKGTTWERPGGMKETVPFALYWIDKFMEDQRLAQLGYNWKDTGKTYFDNYRNTLPILTPQSNIINITQVAKIV